jgi:hypothetical protein
MISLCRSLDLPHVAMFALDSPPIRSLFAQQNKAPFPSAKKKKKAERVTEKSLIATISDKDRITEEKRSAGCAPRPTNEVFLNTSKINIKKQNGTSAQRLNCSCVAFVYLLFHFFLSGVAR